MIGRWIVAQMEGCSDIKQNLQKAERAVWRSKEKYNADFVLFPETFLCYVTEDVTMEKRMEYAVSLEDEAVQKMREIAARYQVWMAFGMREQCNEKNFNTIAVVNDQGELVKTYHKTHLYDAFSSCESDEFLAGDELFTPIQTPFGKIGLFVCYEARFPEIARIQALQGAEIFLMPTAWVNGIRKQEQLQILAQARALENTSYLLAANLCKGNCTGQSLIVDPLGELLKCAGDEEELLFVEIDTEHIQKVRNIVPSLKNRKPELYARQL